MTKLAKLNSKIANKAVRAYKLIETGVVNGYKKTENCAVKNANKVIDACVKNLFAKDGESLENAKSRLSHNL